MVLKNVVIFGGFAFLAVVVVCSVATFKIFDNRPNTQPAKSNTEDFLFNLTGATTQHIVKDLCQNTYYTETCINSLSKASNSSNPKTLVKVGFQIIIEQLQYAINESDPLKRAAKDRRTRHAYKTCRKLLDDSIHDLQRTFNRFDSFDITNLMSFVADLQTWLSGALGYQDTCLDCFEGTKGDTAAQMNKFLNQSRELTINGLGLVKELSRILDKASGGSGGSSRQLLAEKPIQDNEELFPRRERELGAKGGADVVVAQDGSGDVKTINGALAKVPKESSQRFTIHIKAGVYHEYVLVTRNMWNVAFVGDGPRNTKITGKKSRIGGGGNLGTDLTATVAIEGDYFMAKDIGFENTAGPEMEQAVALRVSSDFSVFYNCKIDGNQDTLFVQAHRQFYRDCVITGTVDFIFGRAQAVFQNCKLLIRKPLKTHRFSMVTASGRQAAEDTSAIVLQGCQIEGTPEYPVGDSVFEAYLGRPWKPLARTIIMNSQIDRIIRPDGWAKWIGDSNINTCYYAEVNNKGPGADTSKRVKWNGIKKISPQEAAKFGPKAYLQADTWLPKTGIPYSS